MRKLTIVGPDDKVALVGKLIKAIPDMEIVVLALGTVPFLFDPLVSGIRQTKKNRPQVFA